MKKSEICRKLEFVEERLSSMLPSENEYVDINAYRDHVQETGDGKNIWTAAVQAALNENRAVYFPEAAQPYYMDKPVIIPSDRHIKADPEAIIRQMEGVKTLMFRNEHTVDGTHVPPDTSDRDSCISIIGGRWEESRRSRAGYGKSGMYDEDRSFYGVSTCMLFNNIENLILKDMTFAHTAGFAVQAGEMNGALFENIRFESCYADGLHINGNTENVIIRDIEGTVGDDLVALNVYDWQDSSVNFGPMKTVLCENLRLSEDSGYKAMRIEPGTYYFDDESEIDCSINDLIVRNVTGINTFKLYYQTPAYRIGEKPERGAVGSGDNVYFENITIDLDTPIDLFPEYTESDSLRGAFAGFEFGANLGNVYLDNINIRLYREKFPMSFLACVGPKSVRVGEKEVFDPYLSSSVKNLHVGNITVNGERIRDVSPYLKEIVFEDVNQDGYSTGKGIFEKVEML